MAQEEKFVEALRRALVEVLVPEIRELREELTALRREMDERFAKIDERFAALTREMNERFAKMDERFAALTREMNERFAKMDERFARMDGKLDVLIERDRRIDEALRFAVRLEAVEKKLEKLGVA